MIRIILRIMPIRISIPMWDINVTLPDYLLVVFLILIMLYLCGVGLLIEYFKLVKKEKELTEVTEMDEE